MINQAQEFKRHRSGIEVVQLCLQKRIKTGDRITLTLLATRGSERPSFTHPALGAVCERFSLSLENAGVKLSLVLEEWDMVEYAKQYINLVQ